MNINNVLTFLRAIFFCLILHSIATLNATPTNNSVAVEYFILAQEFKKNGDTQKAIDYYKNALRANPSLMLAAFNLATIYHLNKELDNAIIYYKKVMEIDPYCAQAYHNCATCLLDQENTNQALKYLLKAVKINPNYEKARIQLGLLYKKLGNFTEAIVQFEDVVTKNQNSTLALHNLGSCLFNLNRLDDAIVYLHKAFTLEPLNINLELELANALNLNDQTQQALEHYKNILKLNPHALEIVYNCAYTHKKLGHMREALELYDMVLHKKPDYAVAQFGRSLAQLALGDFEEGFKNYESRWKSYNEKPFEAPVPAWDGTSDLHGKRIFVYAEQGLGDTFQFIRYLKLLKNRGATVIFKPQKALIDILALCPYIDHLVTPDSTIPPFDTHAALMSLPHAFNTTRSNVPEEIPYLYAQEELNTYWHNQLAHDTNFKVGICWQGNPNYRTQILRYTVAAKSMSIADFAPLAQVTGVSFYSLQKVSGEDQLHNLPNGFIVHDFGPNFDAEHGRFMDTAAVIKNLDLVITIDTSICHFAAALGAQVWVMLPNPADWRWMLNCNDTPWYPNMKLFRQETPGDWATVMGHVKNALTEVVSCHASQP